MITLSTPLNSLSISLSWFLDDRSDDEIVTVTAKIWYVSDYLGKYRETLGYQKVDENCVDDEDADEWCSRIISKKIFRVS